MEIPKLTAFIGISLLLLLPAALADRYYVMGISKRADALVLDSFSVEEVPDGIEVQAGGSDRIIVYSKDGNELFSLTMDFSNPQLLLYYIPYQESGERIELKDSDQKALLTIPLELYAKVCGDGVCQAHESPGLCPADCPLPMEKKDAEIASNEETIASTDTQDGRVDEESTENSDTGLRMEDEGNDDEISDLSRGGADEEASGLNWMLILISLLALVGWGVHVLSGRREQNERMLKIKGYVEFNLKKGYPLDQIRHTLLGRGITNQEINEAMKR